jgi:hypothetical protein
VKLFTREEAEALIPELERVFAAILEIAARAEMKAAELRRRVESGRDDEALSAIERSQLQFMASQINERLQEIVALGALPKGVEPALVDFPAVIDGREAYLCWRLGEKTLTHWHGRDEGFSSRKPLPKRR